MPRRRRRDDVVRSFCIGGFCYLFGWLATGCLRFASDVPPDGGPDGSPDAAHDASAEILPEAEADAKSDALDASMDALDGADGPSDVTIDVAPICQRFDPGIRLTIASDIVSWLLQDCRIRSAFASLPPVRLQHLEECLAAQVASVMGCVHPDGTRYKYPAYDSNGQFCRDMKTAHASLTTSDGDFDAFLAGISYALMKNGLTDDEVARALRSFGAGTTRNDIVKLKDAGPTQPTQPCDAGAGPGPEAGPDARAEAASDVRSESAPEAAPDVAPEADPVDASSDTSLTTD